VKHTSEALVVVFEDGKEFIYPAAILYAAIPNDESVAQRVREVLERKTYAQSGSLSTGHGSVQLDSKTHPR
jgi:DUF971 family protein